MEFPNSIIIIDRVHSVQVISSSNSAGRDSWDVSKGARSGVDPTAAAAAPRRAVHSERVWNFINALSVVFSW